MGKNLPADARDSGKIPVWGRGRGGNPLEKKMATHSSILAWESPRTEEPGGLQSMGSQRVGPDLVTQQQYFRCCWNSFFFFFLSFNNREGMSDCDGSGFPVLSCYTWGVTKESGAGR